MASLPAAPAEAPEAAQLDRLLHVTGWSDPLIDDLGHDPRSAYVERFWLPVLGPSTVLLLRRLAEQLDTAPDGFDVHLGDVAAQLGLGFRNGRHQPLLRAIDRACTFGAARQLGDDSLAVRRNLAPLSRRQLQRLSLSLQQEHETWLSAGGTDERRPSATPTATEQRERARSLALSLLQVGESVADAERQLHRWRFHPAMAHEAMRWATAQLEDPASA